MAETSQVPWQPRICPSYPRKTADSLITHTTLQRALKRLTFARPSTTYKRLLTKVSFQQVFNICLLLAHDRPSKRPFQIPRFPQNRSLQNAKTQTGNVKKSTSRQYQSAGYRFATVIVSSILPLISTFLLLWAKINVCAGRCTFLAKISAILVAQIPKILCENSTKPQVKCPVFWNTTFAHCPFSGDFGAGAEFSTFGGIGGRGSEGSLWRNRTQYALPAIL